jgi:hypothetical protein
MPVDPTRRRFLSNAAGVAAGGTVLALATIPPASAAAAPAGSLDPVFRLIEAHRTATALHGAALVEQNRLEKLGDPRADDIAEAPCHADADAFDAFVETVPRTSAGLRAWAAYLGEILESEGWMVMDRGPEIVATFVKALGNRGMA